MLQKLMNVRVKRVAADSLYANNANRKFCTKYGISTSFAVSYTHLDVYKRQVLPSGKMSKTRTITVEKQALAPAKEVAKTTPGLELSLIHIYLK